MSIDNSPERDIRNLKDELRKMRDTLTSLTSLNVDMNGRRTINAKPSRHDHDYIIRAELNNEIEQIKRLLFAPSEPPRDDLRQYILDYNVDRINYGSLSLKDIDITKEGATVNVADVDIDGLYVVAACIDELTLEDGQNQILAANIPGLQETNTIAVVGIAPTGWEVGDYILINNRSTNFIAGAFSFEIFKITGIVGPVVTIVRDGSAPGILTSWFGTPKSAHIGSFYAYKVDILNFPFSLRSGVFYNPSSRTGFAERVDLIIPNVCCVGVSAALYNNEAIGNWTRKLLSTGFLSANPWESGDSNSRCPGLRTLNGAAYYISTTGTLSVGLESDYEIRPNDDSPVRCLWGYVKVAGETTGSTDPVVTVEVIEINESTLAETVVETVNFYTARRISGELLYAPETRQLSYDPAPNLIGDSASNQWPVPYISSNKRYKTKVTGVGADVVGENLVMVMST